jgi:carbamoyl-phosphate synthase large subunit
MRILVTAISGDIGYGIGKILHTTGVADFTVGCDIHKDHAGDLFFDKCEILPKANADGYVDTLVRIARENHVDLVIPASEAEIRFLFENGLQESLDDIPLVMANTESLHVGLDKLRTTEFLKERGLTYPWTQLVRDGPPPLVPCIVKDRFGAGGRSVAIVAGKDVPFYSITHSDGIWQELLEPEDEEYTCGLYRSPNRILRHIAIRRTLAGGSTKFGRVVGNDPQIEALLTNVAEHLDLRGSINVQLRLTPKGPTIFEINPRFSSTLVFRHALGFQDVIWSIKERLGERLPDYVAPTSGTAFYRGYEELIIPIAKRQAGSISGVAK